MDQDVTWYGVRPRPRRLVLHGDPAPSSRKGGNFEGKGHAGRLALMDVMDVAGNLS